MLETILLSTICAGLFGVKQILDNGENKEIKNEETKNDYVKETEDYLRKLSADEIKDYVKDNYILSDYDYKIYGTCNEDDKDLVIKHICEIAEKEERSFTNKYSRY